MERFPKLESLFAVVVTAAACSMQVAWADPGGPPGAAQQPVLIAQQSGWPNNPPAWQNNPAPSSLPAPPPQQTYQPSYPQQDMSQAQATPTQGYPQQAYGAPQIAPGQLQGYPVSQQAPGQLPPQAYQQQGQYPQQQYGAAPGAQPASNMQFGNAQTDATAPSAPAGWTADYPNPNEANNNSTAANIPMDTAKPKKAGIGSMIGKALGGVARMSPAVAGAGMAGMTNMAMGNMYGMGGMGMGGYGMPYGGMGMGMPMGMGMGMGGMGMGGMGMGMPMGGMGMGGNMMMNSVLNQGLRMLQQR